MIEIICEECDTTSKVPKTEVGSMLESHNENLHNDEPIAYINPTFISRFSD